MINKCLLFIKYAGPCTLVYLPTLHLNPGLSPSLSLGPPSHHHADFGLCELLDPTHTHVSNHGKGTPFYMAPETTQNQQVGWVLYGPRNHYALNYKP